MSSLQQNLLDHAITYAHAGLYIFPCYSIIVDGCSCNHDCTSPGKHPITPNGLKDATTDLDQIKDWWSNPYNIAIATGTESNLFVLDVDPRHGGNESLQRLESEWGQLPPPAVLTGSGGHHYYFRLHRHQIQNSESKLAPGLDIRAIGGYVIAPPSWHQNRTFYELLEFTDPIHECPLWLLDLIFKASPQAPHRFELPQHIPHRQRNATLHAYACSLANFHSPAEVLEQIRKAYHENCAHEPPISDSELMTLTKSAIEFVNSNPRISTHTGSLNGTGPKVSTTPANSDDRKLRSIEWPNLVQTPLRWYQHGWLPQTGCVMVDGDMGMGKSLVLIDTEARFSRFDSMLNGDPNLAGQPIHCCYFDKEEGPESLMARFKAAGANLDYIHVPDLRGKSYLAPNDLTYFRDYLLEHDCRIVVYDGIQHFVDPRIDMSKDTQKITLVLDQFNDLSRATNCLQIIVRHFTKGSDDKKLIHKGAGSTAFSGTARAGWAIDYRPGFSEHDEDPEYMIQHAKHNDSEKKPAIAYKITKDPGDDAAHIECLGTVAKDELQPKGRKAGLSTSEARALLERIKAAIPGGGLIYSNEIDDACGIGHSSLNRIKQELGIKSKKSGDSPKDPWICIFPSVMNTTPTKFYRLAEVLARADRQEIQLQHSCEEAFASQEAIMQEMPDDARLN